MSNFELFITSPSGIVLSVLLIVLVLSGGYLLWTKLIDEPKRYEMGYKAVDAITPNPLQSYKIYAQQLDRIIEDISKKSKSIKDEEIRTYWTNYVQELRVRQLKVLQQIHDREYRELEHKDVKFLTDSDIHSKDARVERGIELANEVHS